MPGKEALCLLACRVFFSLLVHLNSSTTSPLLHLIASLPLSYSFSLSSAFFHGSSSCFTPVLQHYLPLHPSPLCQVLFLFPLSTHFLLLFPCPPSPTPHLILPAPDGSFYGVNWMINVTLSQLFSACSLIGFRHLILTSNALHSLQRASPSKKQRNNSSAGGNEPVFAHLVAH